MSLWTFCEWLRNTATKERLKATCFHGCTAQQFHKDLNSFSAKVNRKRWGTVAFAVSELTNIRLLLKRYWNLDAYASAGTLAQPVVNATLKGIDEAIESDNFWSHMLTLRQLFAFLCETFKWVEGCSCHTHLDWDVAPPWLRQRWGNCPMRGCRLAEAAGGDLLSELSAVERRDGSTALVGPTFLCLSRACG